MMGSTRKLREKIMEICSVCSREENEYEDEFSACVHCGEFTCDHCLKAVYPGGLVVDMICDDCFEK